MSIDHELQDQTKIMHLINGICRGIEIENLPPNSNIHQASFPDDIMIGGKRVAKDIAFGLPNMILPSLLLRSDIILDSIHGDTMWDMNYELSDDGIAGFRSFGDMNLSMCMLKVSVLNAVVRDMVKMSADGLLDFTESLQHMAHTVSQSGLQSFKAKDIAPMFNVQVISSPDAESSMQPIADTGLGVA